MIRRTGWSVELMCTDMASAVIAAENSVCTVNEAAGGLHWLGSGFLIRLKTLWTLIKEEVDLKVKAPQTDRGLTEVNELSQEPDAEAPATCPIYSSPLSHCTPNLKLKKSDVIWIFHVWTWTCSWLHSPHNAEVQIKGHKFHEHVNHVFCVYSGYWSLMSKTVQAYSHFPWMKLHQLWTPDPLCEWLCNMLQHCSGHSWNRQGWTPVVYSTSHITLYSR